MYTTLIYKNVRNPYLLIKKSYKSTSISYQKVKKHYGTFYCLMNKFPNCHVFDGQVVRAAAPGIGETCDRILFTSLYKQKYFPLHEEDKFPLWEGYIFESKIPLVVRIGLAAPACGSGIGPSPSNSVYIYQGRYFVFVVIGFWFLYDLY